MNLSTYKNEMIGYEYDLSEFYQLFELEFVQICEASYKGKTSSCEIS